MRFGSELERDPSLLTRRRALQLAGFGALASSKAFAQTYPNSPITVVIPLPPGSIIDVLGRGCSEQFRKDLGHPFVIEDVPGATSTLGAARVAHSRPDGYTALLTVSAPIVTSVFTMKHMSFDPDKDLAPVILAAETIDALVVHKSLPVTTLQEYIAYAKAHPGQLAFGSPGIGSPHHIAGEFLASLTGIQLVHVPYKGSNESTADLIAGHVPSAIVTLGGVTEQAKAGTVRILAVTSDRRAPTAPNVPTIGEIVPGYAHAPGAWTGMFVPAATSKDIIRILNREMNVALKNPDFVRVLNNISLFPIGGPPDAITERVRYEREITKSLLGRLGLTRQ